VFVSVLVYVNSRTPPYPSYHECNVLCAALEGAKSAEQLQALFAADAPMPTLLPANSPLRANSAGLAAAVWQMKRDLRYTSLGGRDQRTPDERLLFRVHSATEVLDYHELRLARRDGKLEVVDLRSSVCDAWASDLVKEEQRLDRSLPAGTLAAIANASAAADPAKLEAILRNVPAPASPLVDLFVLNAHRNADVAAFRAAVSAFRTAHPDSGSADLFVLVRAQIDMRAAAAAAAAANGKGATATPQRRFDEALRRDAIRALDQIEKRIDDDKMWTELRRRFES
jgi:hypothetical protein